MSTSTQPHERRLPNGPIGGAQLPIERHAAGNGSGDSAEWNHPAIAGASAQFDRAACVNYRLANPAALV
jgi:hypothetical protein